MHQQEKSYGVTRALIHPIFTVDATGSSPAIADGIVYMGFPDGNVAALDAATGKLKWKYRTNGGIISSAAISGETVYIGSNDGNLYAFDRLTGQPLWQHEIGAGLPPLLRFLEIH